ncbi:TetR family transcriptional regulator [Sphaerisporangium rufum]|uniref:TetR family transcriptional regulator n=1 Tax=Sphaerisporangium rufum TaxID=1381558 RepID=A0A919R6Y1_9ACTN|nr:TetR/AcrR family transcriptional regulator [Sphaerisporangium rufum]GII79390.1 TetR family transcriptional regulator [Sphaerisporangium rufum]
MATSKPAAGVRAAKAAATRARMLDAAKALFLERGYAATAMQAIAARAGVAVQTLYFTFTTKRAILKELLDVEVAGDTTPMASLDRPWVGEAFAAAPAAQLRLMARRSAEIYGRVGPLLEVVRSAAAADPEIAELWRTNQEQRHTVFTVMTGALAAKTPLREGFNAARAADTVLAVLAPESYHLLVHERGWPAGDWEEWAADALIRQLLPDPAESS